MKYEESKAIIFNIFKSYRKLKIEFTIKDIIRFDNRLSRLSVYYYIKQLLDEGTLKTVKKRKGRGNENSYKFIN